MDKVKIIIASALWGIVGLFAQLLFSLGLKTNQIAGLRFCFSAIIMAIILLFKDIKLFKCKNLFLCAIIGLSNFATTICYYNCIKNTGGGVASVLLFTSPIFVVIFLSIYNKKSPSKVTMLGIILCLLGLMLAGNVFTESVNKLGFLFGVCSAITNAVVTLVGAKAVKGQSPLTVNFYGFLFSALLGLIFIKPSAINIITLNTKAISILIILALFCTILPYTLYISALKSYSQEKASLLCSIELIVANLLECIIFARKITFSLILGIIGIIVAVWLVGISNKKEGKEIDKQILQTSVRRVRKFDYWTNRGRGKGKTCP